MQRKIFLPLLSAVSAVTLAADAVTNGGFESGAASPWVVGGGGSAHVASNSDSTSFLPVAAHSGTHFLIPLALAHADELEPTLPPSSELSNNGVSASTTVSQEVAVVAGTTYHFSAFYAAFDQPLDGCFASAAVGITPVASATLFASQSGNGITVPSYFALNGTYVAPAGSTGEQSLVSYMFRELVPRQYGNQSSPTSNLPDVLGSIIFHRHLSDMVSDDTDTGESREKGKGGGGVYPINDKKKWAPPGAYFFVGDHDNERGGNAAAIELRMSLLIHAAPMANITYNVPGEIAGVLSGELMLGSCHLTPVQQAEPKAQGAVPCQWLLPAQTRCSDNDLPANHRFTAYHGKARFLLFRRVPQPAAGEKCISDSKSAFFVKELRFGRGPGDL
ncbi:hypothetical protein GGX14DRAFT_544239 [Mycena pura]|uniref:Uncharacterized protein n=1 Tax=Mycena pura TaxID=153505 RepID=A0AAD6Y9I4_9AGAR|nr:hypothetical protein GGX14DRAFT_544239 [Mycena pura]